MLSIQPTPTGIGVILTTDTSIMHALYILIDKVLNIDYTIQEGTDEPRGLMLQSFAYDVRHSFMDADFATSNGTPTPCTLRYIWPDIIIYLMCLRQEAAYATLNTSDQSLINVLEDSLKSAMWTYDEKGAQPNEHLIQPLFDLNTDILFLLQHKLHNHYILRTGRKTAFRELAPIMHSYLDNYGLFRRQIERQAIMAAQFNNCTIRDLRNTDGYLEVKKW